MTTKMFDKSNVPVIMTEEDSGSVRMFFHPRKFDIVEERLKTILNGLVYNGTCSGYDADRALNGDVWIYFNPVLHNSTDRQVAVEKIMKLIEDSAIDTNYEDDEDEE